MGIAHFFSWFRANFHMNISNVAKGQTLTDIGIIIDTLMLDMNGIYHPAAQRAFEYGEHKPNPRMLNTIPQPEVSKEERERLLFEIVCHMVENIMATVQPVKRVVLCVDGPAPRSKQNQQRQRRFRAANEKTQVEFDAFDSNCITPGTKFMDKLSRYIDVFIKRKIQIDPNWKQLEIVFSNEKAPGEGEHKLMNYIRKYGNEEERYCIVGADADLIMLTLATKMPNFYLLRPDMYNQKNEYYAVNMGGVAQTLSKVMEWKGALFDSERVIDDFVLMCFLAGNDFLPHSPTIEIIEGGINTLVEVYKKVCEKYGHLTFRENGAAWFLPKAFGEFLRALSDYEKTTLEKKLERGKFFPDPILQAHAEKRGPHYYLNIQAYRASYTAASFHKYGVTEKQVCHEYLEGLQWVLYYYTKGVYNWRWCYPYHYAPFAFHLYQHIETFKMPFFEESVPYLPFQQLLFVLPPKSAKLLPSPLDTLLTNEKSALKPFCPNELVIDRAGKYKEWEGVVLIPLIDPDIVQTEYEKLKDELSDEALKRNHVGRTFVYVHSDIPSVVFGLNLHVRIIDI